LFATVRYFVKTAVIFLIIGILSGLYMSAAKNIFHTPFGPELISAHAHIILVGSVMMMIMGVALWFFPRAEKTDRKYNPALILVTYWLMSISTATRFIFQSAAGFIYIDWINIMITITSTFQAIAIILFFFSIWGRIRPVGSQYSEAKGERF
jgi:heme/copper-type cytochrome/quinol oxidase subunit 1